MRIQHQHRQEPRRGFVIVAVLLVIAVLTLAAYQYSTLMSAEYLAADRMRKATEAKVLADSGIHYACAMLADPDAFTGQINENPFDNAAKFQAVIVRESESARAQGRFSLVAPDYSNVSSSTTAQMKFGMMDESGKININAFYAADSTGQVLHDVLMKLPNMTDDIAWSIVDWLDTNDEPSVGGAESQYYTSLTPPFQCKNGPLDTIEELLLVKGVTPALLYGTDVNRNGKVDPGEDDTLGFTPGWAAFLTIYSRERNVDSEGKPRININGNDLTTLNNDLLAVLSPEMASFIIAYRLYGGTIAAPGATPQRPGNPNQLQQTVQQAIRNKTQPRQRISSLFSLLGSQVTVQSNDRRQPATTYVSPVKLDASSADLLEKLLDHCSTTSSLELPAKVNVNTAPREVLLALPGMTDADADLIIAKRPTYLNGELPDVGFETVGWLLSNGGIKPTVLQSLERYVTARTQVYRVISVGYFDEVGPIARVEAVIDVNQGKPRISYYRDLTDQGRAVDPRVIGQ